MNQLATVAESRDLSPSQQFRIELDKMGEQFAAALPAHIKPEKFQRVVMTAVVSDPDILRADRKSLMESAIRAAQDGLLPDKREGAFVVFNTKVKIDGRDSWVKAVQWMPMVGGIIKRIHQSGEIKMLTARVVYGGDHFRTWIDDTGEHVEYEPSEDQDTSIVRRVFAMATTVDGAVYVEPLSSKDVEKIRNVSKQKDRGPWADWWEEMAKKSAIRRLAKRLPLSVDLHDLIQRDNAMFDLAQEQPSRPSLADRLNAARNITPATDQPGEGFTRALASGQVSEQADAETGELFTQPDPDGAATSPSSDDASATSSLSAASEPEDDSPPSSGSTISADDLPKLRSLAKDMLPRAANPETSGQVMKSIEARYADDIAKLSPAGREAAKSISVSMRSILKGDVELISALEFFAEMLDCTVEELGG